MSDNSMNIPDRPARPWDLFNKNIGRVQEKIHDERMAICLQCPELIKMTKQCKKCGCLMEAKTKLPNAECPLGKWKRTDIPYTEEI
jgi:hypothetical protein